MQIDKHVVWVYFQVVNFDHLYTERFYPFLCVFWASIYFNSTRFSKFIPIISKPVNWVCKIISSSLLILLIFFLFLILIVYGLLLSRSRTMIGQWSDNDPLKVWSISLILDNHSSVFFAIINANLYCQSNFLSYNYISRIWVSFFRAIFFKIVSMVWRCT
jgi:hypothetical protein